MLRHNLAPRLLFNADCNFLFVSDPQDESPGPFSVNILHR